MATSNNLTKRVGNKWMAKAPGGTSLGLYMTKQEAYQVGKDALDALTAERHSVIH